jgi:SAM-dependent methyltransferase
MSAGNKRSRSTYDYQDYWQKRLYDSEQVPLAQRRLFAEYVLPGTVLDLGCGCGRFAALFEDYVGVDLNERAIQIAKWRHPAKDFRQLDIVTAELPKAANIITSAVLQHIPSNLIGGVVEKLKADNIMLFESIVDGYLAPRCFNHEYERLFGKAYHQEKIPDTPTYFMVFR